MGDFYDPGAVRHVAINLFYGWGYNFYRKENQLRQDDQLIRAQAGKLIGDAAAAVVKAETDYRRSFPEPSRAQPFPPPEMVSLVRAVEQFGKTLVGINGLLTALPTPENDRMTQRYRKEADTLQALGEIDETLIGQCALMREAVSGKPALWIGENLGELENGVAAIKQTIQKRSDFLAMLK